MPLNLSWIYQAILWHWPKYWRDHWVQYILLYFVFIFIVVIIFRKRLSGAHNDLEPSPCKMVTPVRRSTRRSLSGLPEQLQDRTPVYRALEDIPSPDRKSTLFLSNPALGYLLDEEGALWTVIVINLCFYCTEKYYHGALYLSHCCMYSGFINYEESFFILTEYL